MDLALGFDAGAHSHSDGCFAYSTTHQPPSSESRPQRSNVEIKCESGETNFRLARSVTQQRVSNRTAPPHTVPASAPVRTMHAMSVLVSMEGVAEVTAQNRVTTTALCLVIEKELLANSIHGCPSKQAPRMFISIMAALEELTVNILPSVFMVDSSPVMVHDALQRPSLPQAKRHSRDRKHDVRPVDEVENDRR